MNQKRLGIILSYANLFVGMVVNLFLTPLLITTLGDMDYSIFKVMQSFAGPLSMFNLGVSTIVTRSIVKCETSLDYSEQEKRNTMALALLASVFMSVLVLTAGLIMRGGIPSIYSGTYNPRMISVGQSIFFTFVVSTVFHILTDAFSGCIVGHEKFAVRSSIQLFRTIFKFFLIYALLKCGFGALAVARIDVILSIGTFLFTALYSIGVLKETPKLTKFDGEQIKQIFLFGSAILLQAIVNQVNNNVDIMILGAYVNEKSIVTMYSSALAIYSIYNSLISVMVSFFLPKATKLVMQNASGKELTDFVIKPGRFQAMIAVGCICGFTLFGQNFIMIWIGERYLDAYWITLMLMIPVTIPLVENAAISILDASLKRIYRSIVLVVMALLNVVFTIIGVSYYGFWGAAVATVISLIIGHGFMMNIYYARTFNLEIGRMLFSIFKGILPAGIVASLCCIPMTIMLNNTTLHFIVKCSCFIIVYFLFLWLFGMNKSEKNEVKKIVKKSNETKNL